LSNKFNSRFGTFFNVIFGGFGDDTNVAAAGGRTKRTAKSGRADDAAFILGSAETVVIVPGDGLAVACTQHALKELAHQLTGNGITVKYAIHPVVGPMPILEGFKAKTIIVNKHSMAAGYAGLDNEQFYMDKTMMVFCDAEKVVEDGVKAIE
jgi:NAD/NADP transhydrogenase beta subunit